MSNISQICTSNFSLAFEKAAINEPSHYFSGPWGDINPFAYFGPSDLSFELDGCWDLETRDYNPFEIDKVSLQSRRSSTNPFNQSSEVSEYAQSSTTYQVTSRNTSHATSEVGQLAFKEDSPQNQDR